MDRNNEYLNLFNGSRDKAVEIIMNFKHPQSILDTLECVRDLQRKEEETNEVKKIPHLSKDDLIKQFINSLYSLRESSKKQYEFEACKF